MGCFKARMKRKEGISFAKPRLEDKGQSEKISENFSRAKKLIS